MHRQCERQCWNFFLRFRLRIDASSILSCFRRKYPALKTYVKEHAKTILNSSTSLQKRMFGSQSLGDNRQRRCDWIRWLHSEYLQSTSKYFHILSTMRMKKRLEPVASEMKLLGSARSRKGESHSGWNVVGGNDVVDTWKSGDIERREKERRRGDEETHSSNEWKNRAKTSCVLYM